MILPALALSSGRGTRLSLPRDRFREQKTMVRRDNRIIAVEIIDDLADEIGQFLDCLSCGLEGIPLGSGFVATGINFVVVNVDKTFAGD